MVAESINCQVCGRGGLEAVLDLGYQPLCNEYLPRQAANGPRTFYPLCLYFCNPCSLTQLGYVLPTTDTFGDQYTYLTGSSRSLVTYYADLAVELVKKYGLKPGDSIVEIGSNDGTFLKSLQSLGMHVVGIEGATSASSIAAINGIPTITQFFGKGISSTVKALLPEGSKIRLILAMNVLAHTDNINEFLPEVVSLMDADTAFISSSHWLLELIRNFEFDTIYHEHLRYYTLGSLSSLLERHGLNVVDAERTDFYGGSIMVCAKKSPGVPSESLLAMRKEEEQVDVVEALRQMKDELLVNKTRMLNLLVDLKTTGHKIVGVGAPMKASTLLNFFGITSDLVESIAEVNQLKIGTVVPGVGIPVVREDEVLNEQPDYAILLSWNMADDIIPKYRSMGYTGKFIIPVPQAKVIE